MVLTVTPVLGSLGNVSIVAGWFPVFLFWTTVAVCVAAVVLRRDVLKEFAFGIPIGIAFAALLFTWLHFAQAIPAGAPQSLYLWLIATCLVAGLVLAGWRRARWARRIAGLIAIVLALVVGGQRGERDVPVLPDLRSPVRQERQQLPRQLPARRHPPRGGQDR